MGANVKGPLGPIQVIPPGLMGLLQLKQQGRLPTDLADSVQPVLEMRDWYFTGRRVATTALFPGAAPLATFNVPGVQTFVPSAGGLATVPNGQYWYVDTCAAYGTLAAAADTVRYSLVLLGSQGGDLVPLSVDYADAANARVRRVMARADKPFWAQPGDQFAIYCEDVNTATNIVLSLSLRAAVLPA